MGALSYLSNLCTVTNTSSRKRVKTVEIKVKMYPDGCARRVKNSVKPMMNACSSQASSQTDPVRPLGNFEPCIWGDHFASYSFDDSIFESYSNEIEELKEHVRGMLSDATTDPTEKISLINTLHRLGVSYHFEREIDGLLECYFVGLKLDDLEEYDLYTISMQFRVFRQHGYKMSCDVFHKFINGKGKFKQSLVSDVKGMLSLYEASQLRLRGENVLEEALAFTTAHLERVEAHQSPHLIQQVTRAMEQSFHKGVPRVEARVYISIYEEDESHNELILKLAKLDYNLVQLMYQQELSLLSRWWKDLGLSLKLPYARNRVVESFLFTVIFCFEPRYSLARIIFSKILIIGPWIDDTYDAYGTIEELQHFTDVITRWDINVADQLPDYMKFICSSLFNLYDDIDKQMAKCGRSYAVNHSKEAMKDLCRAYYQEAEWLKNNYIPSFDEYIEIAYTSNTFYLLVTSVYIGMVDTATKEAYEWLQTRPKIFKAAATIGRLQNDIVDIDQYDEMRDWKASAVKCYKKQYGVSDKEALKEIQKMIADSWKDINEECLKPSVVQSHLLMPFLNFARVLDVIYKNEDGFSKPEVIKEIVTSLFVDAVPV